LHEFRFPDKTREIAEEASCGCRRIPTRDLKSGSALQAKKREGPGDSGRARWPSASEWYQSERISLLFIVEKKEKFHHVAEKR
jgi:hypothetical protein